MANYIQFKSKKFKLKKEATAWTKKQKADSPGQGLKIETNFLSGQPMPWEGIVLKKE